MALVDGSFYEVLNIVDAQSQLCLESRYSSPPDQATAGGAAGRGLEVKILDLEGNQIRRVTIDPTRDY